MKAIERFREQIPERPYYGTKRTLGERTFVIPHIAERDIALKHPLIQPNHPWLTRYICLDLDPSRNNPNRILDYEEHNAIPNLVVANPDNGSAHYIYELTVPIWTKNQKATAFLNDTKRALTICMNSDKAYNGRLVKNPIHTNWNTHSPRVKSYDLSELMDFVYDYRTTDWQYRAVKEREGDGRNDSIFQTVRFIAMREVDLLRAMSEAEAIQHTHQHCIVANRQFPYPLLEKDLWIIAKSITKWTRDTYTGSGKAINRGIMGLSKSLPINVKQQMSANRTHNVRRSHTLSSIVELIRSHPDISRTKVGLKIGKHRNTITKYWEQASEVVNSKFTNSN